MRYRFAKHGKIKFSLKRIAVYRENVGAWIKMKDKDFKIIEMLDNHKQNVKDDVKVFQQIKINKNG